MRLRHVLLALLGASLLVAGGLGWSWGWREHVRAQRADFDRQRVAFLESEIERLRNDLIARQQADENAATTAQRTEIEHTVSRLRALNFLRPVVYKQIPRAELPAILRQKLVQQVPDQEFTADGVALAALGLLPAGMDLKKTYLELLGEQIGAFYDQHTQELFTFSGQPLSNGQNRVILAHELTHALEDQHFSLARLPLESQDNDDRSLAATALVEGDATLVMNEYMVGQLSAGVVRDALSSALTTDVRKLAAAPRFLRETLLFPYLRGQEFCQALYAEGGWAALAEAFHHPPSSTAEILHPALFLARPRTEPVAIAFPDTTVLGQKPVDDNVLGEFGLRQLFARWLHDEPADDAAAAGWRGDRYLVYGDAKAAGYVWEIASDDEAAAAKLCVTLRASLAARYPLPAAVAQLPIPPGGGQVLSAQAGGRWLGMWLAGQKNVIVIDAPDARWSEALREKFLPK
jgi:hypothetical protein